MTARPDRTARSRRRTRTSGWGRGPDGRPAAPPRASFEETEIHTTDGVALRALVLEPPPDVPLRATCVLAHAMFARKSEWGRPDRAGVASALAAIGLRTIAFDFRGHGESRLLPDKIDWGYDDLVRHDLPAVVECARARAEEKPVIVAGHSLGGHVALAAQGTGRMAADAILCLAANVWLRELEPSPARWAAKRVLMQAGARVLRGRGVPARALGIGSDDASPRYFSDLMRFGLEGTWRSADGEDDYLARLAAVRIPVCSVASEGDLINCAADCAEAFVRRCGGPVEIVRVTRGDDGGPPPGHMELVTTERARGAILHAARWTLGALA